MQMIDWGKGGKGGLQMWDEDGGERVEWERNETPLM